MKGKNDTNKALKKKQKSKTYRIKRGKTLKVWS